MEASDSVEIGIIAVKCPLRRGGLMSCAALAWFSVALTVQVAAAQSVPVAQISDMTPAVRQGSTVQRYDGQIDHAVPGLPVYTDDVVRVVPCEPSLGIIFADLDHDAVHLPDMGCEYRVRRLPPLQPSAKVAAFLQGLFGLLFNRAPPERPIPTYSQGTVSDNAGQGWILSSTPGVPPQSVLQRRQALLHQAGTQTLTNLVRRLYLLWNPVTPPPFKLTLSQNGKTMATLDVPSDIDAVLTLPTQLHSQQSATITIMAGDKTIETIAIAVVAAPDEPLAPGLTLSDVAQPAAATVQGLWLLANAGPAWRLQAMARLQESVAANQDFLAARVLRALAAGEWVPPAN
jgi:hypothetical protein